jgi:glycine cleavage system transcriptional repressor
MKTFVLSVIGQDRPGIVARVSALLDSFGCSIEDISQTILKSEFAAIFIFTNPREEDLGAVQAALDEKLGPLELACRVKATAPVCAGCKIKETDPFVVTSFGRDRPGQVAGISRVMERFGCNISNLKGVNRSELGPGEVVMIFEIDAPKGMDIPAFRTALAEKTRDLDLTCSVQHREIFESINRV